MKKLIFLTLAFWIITVTLSIICVFDMTFDNVVLFILALLITSFYAYRLKKFKK
jgi:hypothetical protein